MEGDAMYFNVPGPENTGETLKIAVREAIGRKIPEIVVATTTGTTAFTAAEEVRNQGYGGKLICVTHVYGSRENGKNPLPEEDREKLKKQGVILCTAAHALSGAERCLSRKFQGAYPVEIIAHTLRMLGQGMKVCVEITAMALDAGLIQYGVPVLGVGGTGRGADTAVIITPGYTNAILETKVHEILCKPL